MRLLFGPKLCGFNRRLVCFTDGASDAFKRFIKRDRGSKSFASCPHKLELLDVFGEHLDFDAIDEHLWILDVVQT